MWEFDPSAWVNGTTIVTVADYQEIASDLHTRGGNVDGAGYGRANTAFVNLIPGALPGTTYTATGASWLAGVATLTIGGHAIGVRQLVTISGILPAGYNGTVAVTAVTSTTIGFALGANPGAYASGGAVLVGSIPAYGTLAVDANNFLKIYAGGAWVAAVTAASGAQWWTGAGAPASGLGNNSDWYIDKTIGNYYGPKTAGAWGSIAGNLAGPAGAAGTNGTNGTNGAPGAAGTNGTNGTNGAPGAAATVTVGTTVTGAPGSAATVTNSGTTAAAVLNFSVPQGLAGSGSGNMLTATYDPAGYGSQMEAIAHKGAASGYASLDSGTHVPIAQIPTGATSSTVPLGNDTRFPASVTGLRKGAGAGSADVAAVAQVDYTGPTSALYNFAAISPGGALTVGSNTINLGILPAGVAAASIGVAYLYLSGGTGTAEAVPITNVSGTSVTVTCAYTHSGAWTVSSATAGIQENVIAAGANARVWIPPGQWNIYAPISVQTRMQFRGAGARSTILAPQSPTQDVFDVVTPADSGVHYPVVFKDLGILSATPATGGNFISVTAASSSFNNFTEVADCYFYGTFTGLNFQNCAYFNVHDCVFEIGQPTNGTYILAANPASVDSGDSSIHNNWFFGNAGTTLSAITYQSGGGLRVRNNKFLATAVGLNAVCAVNGEATELSVVGNNFDGCIVDALMLKGASGAFATDIVIASNVFNGSPTHAFLTTDANGGTLTRVVINGNEFIQAGGTGTVLNLVSCGGLSVSGNLVNSANNGTAVPLYAGASTVGLVSGNTFSTYSNLGYSVSGSGLLIQNNFGLDNVIADPTEAATLPVPLNPNFAIQGIGATITAVSMPTAAAGQKGTFTTAAALTFSAGASIGQGGTTTATKLYQWFYDGTKFWITGPGF